MLHWLHLCHPPQVGGEVTAESHCPFGTGAFGGQAERTDKEKEQSGDFPSQGRTGVERGKETC